MSESSTDMLYSEDICRPCVRSRHSRATVCIMSMRITRFPAICGIFSSSGQICVLDLFHLFSPPDYVGHGDRPVYAQFVRPMLEEEKENECEEGRK